MWLLDRIKDPVVEYLQAQDFTNLSLNQLRKLKMQHFSGFEPEMHFVKILLAHSTILKKMTILANQASRVAARSYFDFCSFAILIFAPLPGTCVVAAAVWFNSSELHDVFSTELLLQLRSRILSLTHLISFALSL